MAVDALETPVPVFLPPELLEVSLPGKIPFLFHAAGICEKKNCGKNSGKYNGSLQLSR